MEHISDIDIAAGAVAGVAAQIVSTLWFTVLFGEPWAREYGVGSRQQHTSEIPGYTYGVQLVCTVALTVSLAVLQGMAGVESVGSGLALGLFVAIGLAAANMVPGQAFLKRWRVAGIATGAQAAMILVISAILAGWR